MKKIMIFAAFAALLSVASCQKEAVDKSVESPVFTATIAGDSKTTINLNDGKIAWESNDEITVKDASSNSAIYVIESISETGRATFVIKSGETALGNGPYTATYGSAPAASQTYSETAGKLYMTAPETSTNSFTFTVACGLMKLKLTKAGESVKSVTVTGIPTGGSETTYTLNCSTAVSIASGANFCVALPAGSYTKIAITNASNSKCTLNSNSPLAINNNHIIPVTIAESKIIFQPNIIDGVLSGKFSVSPTKKVQFSKGNLQAKYDGTKYIWSFAENQYDCIGNGGGNKTIKADKTNDIDAIVDLFSWPNEKTNYGIIRDGISFAPAGTWEGAFKDWGELIGDGNTWYTPTIDEWYYLFFQRTASTVNSTSNARYAKAKVNGIAGMILLPDGYTHPAGVTALKYINVATTTATTTYPANPYSIDDWTKMESAGAVFLPAVGRRDGLTVDNYGAGVYYWSSTPDDTDEKNAYYLYIPKLKVDISSYWRSLGNSVRLVTEAN